MNNINGCVVFFFVLSAIWLYGWRWLTDVTRQHIQILELFILNDKLSSNTRLIFSFQSIAVSVIVIIESGRLQVVLLLCEESSTSFDCSCNFHSLKKFRTQLSTRTNRMMQTLFVRRRRRRVENNHKNSSSRSAVLCVVALLSLI